MAEENVPQEESKPAESQAQAAQAEPHGEDGGEARTEEKPKRGRPRKAAGKAQGVELVLTVTANSESTEWTADVSHGSKRVVKGLAIPAAAVAAAAKDLHPDIAEAIETVHNAAREKHRSRVEQLQAELEAAQRALADLGE